MRFLSELSAFVKEVEDAEDASFDLWTWLPSYRKAKGCLGDYAANVRPSPKDVMKEACQYLADRCNPSQADLDDAMGLYGCPCQGDCPKAPQDS